MCQVKKLDTETIKTMTFDYNLLTKKLKNEQQEKLEYAKASKSTALGAAFLSAFRLAAGVRGHEGQVLQSAHRERAPEAADPGAQQLVDRPRNRDENAKGGQREMPERPGVAEGATVEANRGNGGAAAVPQRPAERVQNKAHVLANERNGTKTILYKGT